VETTFTNFKFTTCDYTNISEKDKKKLQELDPFFDLDNFVLVYNISPLGSAAVMNRLAFILFGFYFFDKLSRKYINYKDIKFMTIKQSTTNKIEKDSLLICIDGDEFKISSIFFNKDVLKSLLENIVSVSSEWMGDKHTERLSGTVKRSIGLDKVEKAKCHAIIHAASTAAGGVGAGLAQIPLADNVVIAPIQIGMIVSLGAVFGIQVTESMAKGIASTLAVGFIGRNVSQTLIWWIPLLSNVVNATTAASITEAVGWAAVIHFNKLRDESKKNAKLTGIIDGIESASKAYETKFKTQVESFLRQKKVYSEDRIKFINLIEEYEQFVLTLGNS
jgi:uncharacterized protein (DUF697 family)